MGLVRRLLALHDQHFSSFLEQPAEGVPLGGNVPQEILDAGLTATIGQDGYSPGTKRQSGLPKSQITLRSSDSDDSKVTRTSSTEIPKSDTTGRYQFVGELGRGGMGAVLKGRDTEIGRDLAIKVLLERFADDQELLDRFIDEAQIGGQLQHPGIAPVYEMGKFEDNRPYFTMKLVKGNTLAEILADRESPKDDWSKLLPIFEQVCQTIAYAHSKGVIHRDLKPSNIMVGSFGEVQVMDWGLAKVLEVGGDADERMQEAKREEATFIQTRRSSGDSSSGGSGSATRAGSGMGTPAYMPPEQALGEIDILDERADVFGLGAILAEILTGKPAYSGEDLITQARRGRTKDCHKRLNESGADEALVSIAKKALEVEAKDRQRHAGVLSDQVTGYLEGVQERLKESEHAKVAAETRVVEEQRRRKLQLAIAGMLLLLTAGVAVIAWQRYKNEEGERLLEDAEYKLAFQEKEIEIQEKQVEFIENATVVTELVTSAIDSEDALAGMFFAQQAVKKTRDLDSESHPYVALTSQKAMAVLLRQGHRLGGQSLGDGDYKLQRGVDEKNLKDWRLAVGCMVFSPDSRWLAAGCRLWDMDAPNPLRTMEQFTQLEPNDLVFHPSSRWLVCIGKDGSNLIADLASPSDDGFTSFSIDGLGTEVAFHPNGKQLLSANRRKSSIELIEWKDTGEIGERESITTPYPVWYAEFSPDGRWLAIDGFNSQTTLIDLSQGTDEIQFHEVGSAFSTQAFTGNSQWFLAKHNDGSVHCWNLAGDSPSNISDTILRDESGSVNWIVARGNSDQIVTLGVKEPILWDLSAADPASSGKKLYNGIAGGFTPSVLNDRWLVSLNSIWDLERAGDKYAKPIQIDFGFGVISAASPSGKWIAHGSWAAPFPRVWKFDQLQFALSPIALRSTGCHLVSFDDAGEKLFTHGFYTRPLQRYDLTARDDSLGGNLYDPCSLEISEAAAAACLSNNGHWFAEGDSEGIVNIYPMAAKPSTPSLQLQVTDGESIRALGVSNDGQRLLVASGTQTLKLWDLTQKQAVSSIPVSKDFTRRPGRTILRFSEDMRWVHVLLQHQQAELFELDGDQPTGKSFIIPGDRGGKNINAICPNSRWVFSRYGTSAWLWDLNSEDPGASNIELTGLNDIQFPYVYTFSHDGSMVAAGTQTAQAVVWKIDEMEEEQKTLSPWRTVFPSISTIWSLAISPDNRWLACGTRDSLILVWNIEDENPSLRAAIRLQGPKEMENQGNQVCSLAFHPNPEINLLASISADSDTVRLWHLDLEDAIEVIEDVAGFTVGPDDRPW
ncbi:MAG: protein kinase domain-containing protein [Aureliella sp.]